jgi:DNA repair protein RadC
MPITSLTRAYTIPGFRIALVREPGVRLAERPQLRTPADAVPVLSQYIGDADREVFVVAMLTIRHRVLALHTVSIGCLTSAVVHPRLCCAQHNRGYVAAAVMLRRRRKALDCLRPRSRDAT